MKAPSLALLALAAACAEPTETAYDNPLVPSYGVKDTASVEDTGQTDSQLEDSAGTGYTVTADQMPSEVQNVEQCFEDMRNQLGREFLLGEPVNEEANGFPVTVGAEDNDCEPETFCVEAQYEYRASQGVDGLYAFVFVTGNQAEARTPVDLLSFSGGERGVVTVQFRLPVSAIPPVVDGIMPFDVYFVEADGSGCRYVDHANLLFTNEEPPCVASR